MNMEIINRIFDGQAYELTQASLVDLWLGAEYNFDDFEEAKEAFFIILRRLLDGGHVRLAKHGIFLEGTNEEQVERFRKAFPTKETAFFHKPHPVTGKEHFHETWFYDNDCPGGAVWINPDGSYYWT